MLGQLMHPLCCGVLVLSDGSTLLWSCHADARHALVSDILCCAVPADTDALLNSWTVGSFDEAVTLKLLGYPSPHLYYRHACSTNYIPHIRTPTLVMLSKDDPFLG